MDFDRPTPLEVLKKEAHEACKKLEKRQVAFEWRFLTLQSRSDNDAVLNSQEWKELKDWTEGRKQAKA